MTTTLDWASPLTWLTALVLFVLLGVQGWFLFRDRSLSPGKRLLRGGLNLLLWLVVVAYFLQLRWPLDSPERHVLLVGNDVPRAVAQRVSDSLHLTETLTPRTFKETVDSVTLVGQDFPKETLTQLSRAAVEWVPYNQPDQVQDLHYKGLLRQGEQQTVTGWIQSSKKQTLAIRYGHVTLDSTSVPAGASPFTLRFPAFVRGRNQTELVLSGRAVDTLRFFTRASRPLAVQFVLSNPDFETKTLADWLGKQGYAVQLSATLSKNISSAVSINQSKDSGKKIPDIVVTDPSNAANAVVKKAVADGRTVFFLNLATPETESRVINQALGSRFQVRRVSNDPTVPVGNNLNALPYQFGPSLTQFPVTGYPIAIQRASGRVGVSLLSETYPLTLSGDSLTYSRIWTSVLAQLYPIDNNVVQVEAPLYVGLPAELRTNNLTAKAVAIRAGGDTTRLQPSPLNDQSASTRITFAKDGWQPVQDSLMVYVNNASQAQRSWVNQFVLAHNRQQFLPARIQPERYAQLPNWFWLVALLICFTALWVEPKF
ncbi:hypothetical protein [Spirosoma sp. KUDC1026]|uniref:hypothetical protein n=1 Tax=Spirosoma sp. KUDC1026 TaxID=2745947 RepID=UPI00159BED2A|nr:hypothetical protein [Spirosoma sp. KUDC1026]QKZ13601.1 hypothetical protein HU175_13550 [Spirosoma sp. KUDC1026]